MIQLIITMIVVIITNIPFLNIYYAPISFFNRRHALSHLFSTTTIRKRYHYFQLANKENTLFNKYKDI